MWRYEKNSQIEGDFLPGPIPPELLKKGVFIVLESRQKVANIDYDAILLDMDRLLPLYRYVEGGGTTEPAPIPIPAPFAFTPREWRARPAFAVATQAQRQLDVDLRHNELQRALHNRLVSKYGKDNVSFENPSGVGTRVDLVVRHGDEYWYYEIKRLSQRGRVCVRRLASFWNTATGRVRQR